MTRKKILIIEDEKVLLDVLEKKLMKEGFDVFTAENGEIGLRKIREVSPDIVLLDILMPRLNGYEVLEELQKDKRPIPPVIIISNSGQPVEIDRATKLGARDYIIKAEFTPAEVISKVKALLQQTESAPPIQKTVRMAGKLPDAAVSHGIKVLVIEDDQFLRDLMRTKLAREGFDVSTAIDGPEGLERIANDRPHVVLLDIILPGIDGFEILKRMKSSESLKTIPVVLLSNLGQEADVEKGKALGASDYLIKSNFTIDEIIEKIQQTVKR